MTFITQIFQLHLYIWNVKALAHFKVNLLFTSTLIGIADVDDGPRPSFLPHYYITVEFRPSSAYA